MKMPLTLCALSATPLDLTGILNVYPSNSNPSSNLPSSSPTLSSSPIPSHSPLTEDTSAHQISHIGIIAGITGSGIIALIIIFVSIIRWRRKGANQQKRDRRSSATDYSLSPFLLRPAIGFSDTDKHISTGVGPHRPLVSAMGSTMPHIMDGQDGNSGLRSTDTYLSPFQVESRPPSYHISSLNPAPGSISN